MADIILNNINKKEETKNMQVPEISSGFESSLKSNDTEEKIDILFYRPLGYKVALFCSKRNITPNTVTVVSIFIGIAAGILFYPQNIWINIAGMLLLMFANTLDSADGQLARLTDHKSRWGRILDGFAGDFWFTSIHFAIAFRSIDQGWSPVIWVLCFGAGLSHIFQSAMADYYRNVHLYFIKGDAGSELDNSAELTVQYEALSWKKEWFKKFVLRGYLNYTKFQEGLSPNLQKLLQMVHYKYSHRLPKDVVAYFRTLNKPLMKYTNIIQFNTRVIFLFLWLFIDQVWIYFFFDLIVLNSILVYMRTKQEKVSRAVAAYISNQ